MPVRDKVYEKMKSFGLTDSKEDFYKYYDNDENVRKDVFKRLQEDGLTDTEEEFYSYMQPSVSKDEDSNPFDANVERAKKGKPIQRVSTQSLIDANPELGLINIPDLPTLREQVEKSNVRDGKPAFGKPGFNGNEVSALYPTSSETLGKRLSDPRVLDKDMSIRSVNEANEEKKIDTFFHSKPTKTVKDVYDNYSARFTNTERGIELGEELSEISNTIQNKYANEYFNSDNYKKLAKAYQGKELNQKANEEFQKIYGETISNELKPYQEAYNNELAMRYGSKMDEDLKAIAKESVSGKLNSLTGEVESLLQESEDKLRQHKSMGGKGLNAIMGNQQFLSDTKAERKERNMLESAQELLSDSQNIVNEASKKGNTTFIEGLARGFWDNLNAEDFTFGLAELADMKYLNEALQKAENGEQLTPAEEKLLEASTINMATQAYFSSDLGRGYKAGSVSAESIPFMLEFIANPISGSGNAIAKGLLKFGLKRFGKSMTSKAAKTVGRLIGDATAAVGMTSTTGMPNVLAETYNRLNRDYDYGIGENGELYVNKEGNTSFGDAFGKSFTTRAIENQSEMIFHAFKGAGELLKGVNATLPGGVNTFFDYIKNSKVGELWRGIKNSPLRKELAEATKVGGIGEEYLEEVYNNFANVALGEMSMEEALNLDNNIDTFLGLAPTQVMFSMLGLGNMAALRYKTRRDIEDLRATMNESQRQALDGLLAMGTTATNQDVHEFIRNTMANQSLSIDEKRNAVKAAYDVARQKAMADVQEAEVEDKIAEENADIDAKTDPQTGNYGEVTLLGMDESGEPTITEANVFGEKIVDGEKYIRVLPDGETEKKWVRPYEYDAESYQKRPAEEVKVVNEQMIRDNAAKQAEQEAKYAPEVLSQEMQQGIPFEDATAVYIPFQIAPEGNAWQVEVYAKDEKGKPSEKASGTDVITNEQFRDILQAQHEANEAAQQPVQEVAQTVEAEVTNTPVATEEVTPTEEVQPEVVEEVQQPQQQAPVIPTKEDGSIDFVSYGKDNTFKTLGEKYGEKMPNKVAVTAKALAEDLVKAQEKLAKAEEAYDNAPIGREQKAEQARDKAKAELESIQREADFWSSLDNEIKEAQAKRDALLNPKADVDMSEEPMNADEFIAQQLANGNIALESASYKKETGYGEKERQKFIKMFRKAENGGMTIEGAGDLLMQMDRENGTNFFDPNDANAGRDALINFLGSVSSWGDVTGYIRNNREAQAAKETEGLRSEMEDAIEANYHMTPEEYATLQEMEAAENPFEGVDIEAKDAIFAEAALEFEEYLKSLENGQGTTEEVIEGNGDVLSEEQSDNTGGTEQRQGEGLDVSEGTVQSDDAAQEESAEVSYDNQGNPVDGQGNLIIETVNSIDEITDEDFIAPTRSISIPNIPKNVADAIGTNGKPIVIKKNVFEKNHNTHKEISSEKSREILKLALYNPDLVGQTQPIRRPDYKVAIHTGEKNAVVVLDVYQGKDSVEIVGWRYVDAKGLDKMKRQSEREGGQFLILSPNDGSAAALSALPFGSSSEGKDSNLSEENKENHKNVQESIFERAERIANEEARRKPLRQRAKEWEQKLGVKVNIIENFDDVTNKDAKRAIRNGQRVTGWYEESTGEVCLYMPYLESAQEIDATYIHEVVAHKGLRGLLGDKFDEFLDDVWNAMSEADKLIYLTYPGVNGNKRAAADEYVAHLAENIDVTESAWGKLVELIKKFLKAIGLEPKMTNADIANAIKRSYQRLSESGNAENVGGEGTRFRTLEEINQTFNEELQQQIDGTLPNGHIYQLGSPSAVLLSTGIADVPIELNSTRLEDKSKNFGHDYDLSELKDLVKAIHNPMAIFAYGDKSKAQNIIVEIQHEGKNFIVGLSIRPSVGGRVLDINSIRNVFPKDNAEWLNWISQGKMLYADKERIQDLINQQQTNLADVDYLDLDSIANIINDFQNPTLPEEKTLFRTVYHGSSASFDKFDHSFMGTGEGNQSFGWGTYVTDVEGVGKNYGTIALRGKNMFEYIGGKNVNKWVLADATQMMDRAGGYDEMIKLYGNATLAPGTATEQAVTFLKSTKKEDWEGQRHLYEVEIPDDNGSNYIAWDKMLPKEQAERIKEAVRNSDFFKAYEKEYGRLAEERLDSWTKTNGGRAYKLLGNFTFMDQGADKAMSQLLSKAGFVGFVYPANYMSGGNNFGQNNYVIFDEKDLDIKEHTRFRLLNDKNGKKTLVGLHNISENKLRKAIKQGGLANPSVAVIDMDKQSHTDYGDITFVIPSSMIDKKTGKNVGTYLADAYTPVYPTVVKKMSDKGAKALTKALESVNEIFRSKVRTFFNSYLDSGTIYDALSYWYLSDTGKNPPILEAALPDGFTKEEVEKVKSVNPEADSFYQLSEEEKQKALNLYADKFFGGMKEYENHLSDYTKRMQEVVKDESKPQMVRKTIQENLNSIERYGYEYDRVANYYKRAIFIADRQSKPSEIETFRNAFDEVSKNGLEEDFGNWLMAKEEEFGVEEKLFAGYDNQGRAKYLPNTLENASKLMKKEGRAGATGLGGFNYFVAILAPVAKTTKQISAKKGNLSTQEEYDKFVEEWKDYYHDLARQLQPGAGKWDDYGYHRLHEIAPMANPKAYVKKEYGIDLSDKFLKDLNDVKNAIKNDFPARYFETKFERPVYLNEVAAAVVPSDMSLDLYGQLQRMGIPMYEYERGNNEARMAVVDKVTIDNEGIRFRIAPQEEVQAEVDKFTSKYNGKEVVVLNSTVSDEELESLGLDVEDVREAIEKETEGFYDPITDKIYIFADIADADELEKTLFHENGHGIFRKNKKFVNEFNENSKDKFKKGREDIAKYYKEHERAEELFVRIFDQELTSGNFEYLPKYLSEELWNEFNDILKDFGYDRQEESDRRRKGSVVRTETDRGSEKETDVRNSDIEPNQREERKEKGRSKEQAERLKKLFDDVADMGLRGVLGNTNYDLAMLDVFYALPEKERTDVAVRAVKIGGDVAVAVDEYLNSLEEPTLWEKVIASITNALRKVGIDVQLTENDVKYLLWRSRKPLDRNSIFDMAEDIDMRRKLNVGKFDNDPTDGGDTPGGGTRFRTSSEINNQYPNWLDGTTTESGKHSTQVEGTRKTYNKIGTWIEENLGKDISILDASSGMGYGTSDLRERGFNIEDVEPYQSDERKANNPATYSSYNDINKQYDFIISNAVLNVIPDDWRQNVLHDMASRLKDGGRMFINTRKAGEEKTIKDKIELDSPQEVLVKRNGKIASYQKFFTPSELKEWVETELGNSYKVEIANRNNSGTNGLAAVVVTKVAETLNGGTRFRVTPKMDAEYLEAVNSRDMEKAQKMVNEAAKMSMPNTKVVDENGDPLVVYHGSGKKIYTFKSSNKRFYGSPDAYFFTDDKVIGEDYSNGYLIPAFLNIENPKIVDFKGSSWSGEIFENGKHVGSLGSSDSHVKKAHEEGYDGAILKNIKDAISGELADRISTDYVAFESNQIKSAEPVTYDDNGNVIPLSERFNSESNDIRFRVANKLQIRDEYESTIKKGGYQAREAVQDAMLSLRRTQELIEKASGKKLRGFENAWEHENRLSSVVQAEIHEMERKFYKPMMDAVKKLAEAMGEKNDYAVADYLMLKHGIERNREMAVRKALTDSDGKIDRSHLEQWYKDKEAIRNDANLPTWREKQEAMDNAALNYGADMSVDYSGLTSMFGSDDLADCTDKAYKEVEELEKKYPSETKALGKAIKALNQSTIDKSFESGLMDRKVRDELKNDMYDYYVPLRGFDEVTSDEVYSYLDNDRNAFNAPLRRAKGRTSKADNPIAYMKSIAESGIMQGERNKMKQSFLSMVINHPSDLISVHEGVWVVLNPATGEWEAASMPTIPNNATPADVESILEAWESSMEQQAATNPNIKKVSEGADVPYRVIGNRMEQHQVIIKRNGKSYTLTVNGNPRLAMALNGLTNPNNTSKDGRVAADIQKAVDKMNRTLAAWYTTRNPDFVASNFMRDTFYTNTIVRAKEGNKYANKFHKHYAELLMPGKMLSLFNKYENGKLDMNNKTEKAFYDFIMNGGETGYSNLKDIEHIKNEIANQLKGDRLKWFRQVSDKLDLVNRAVENTSRFAAFLTSREMGRDMSKSIFDAKEISVNFNKKGAGGTFYKGTGQTKFGNLAAMVGAGGRGLYVFFNAAIQGSTNLLHVMKVNPKGTSAGLAAMFLMGAVLPYLLSGDDDKDYYDLPDHVRRNHLVLPGPGDSWVSIPLPIEYRIMYGMGELFTSWRTGHERGTNIGLKALTLTGQALPLNFLEEGLDAFVPSALSPLWQAYNNRSWTGLPIYKDNEFNKDDPEYTKAYKNVDRQIYNFTKALYNWTFDEENQEEGIDLNPAIIESLARGYFGGLFTLMSNIVKTAETIGGEREFDWRNIPIGNRIFKSGDERTKEKRITNEYFYNMEKLDFLESRRRMLNRTIDGKAVPEEDVEKAKADLEQMIQTGVYQKHMKFKDYKKVVDKIRKAMNDNGSTEELQRKLSETQEKANEVLR